MMTYLLIGPFIVIENKRHLCVKRKTNPYTSGSKSLGGGGVD
jgi:hypothetical protein